MKLTRNNQSQVLLHQLKILRQIERFVAESGCPLDRAAVVAATVNNIGAGLTGRAAHDIWLIGEADGYCLGRVDRDADNQLVYTLYQLYVEPGVRGWKGIREILAEIGTFAKEQGYVRLYLISSRLDSIRAYGRGIGKGFTAQSVIFAEELKTGEK